MLKFTSSCKGSSTSRRSLGSIFSRASPSLARSVILYLPASAHRELFQFNRGRMSTFFSELFFGKPKKEEFFVEGAEFYVGTHIYIGRDLLRNLSNLEAFTKQCNSAVLNSRFDHSRPVYRPIHESREVFHRLREVLKARKHYLDVLHPDSSTTCCCISKWKDAPVTSVSLCNQVLEAFMTVQSSEALSKHLDCKKWVSSYIFDASQPILFPTAPSQIKLMSGRYEMAERMTALAEASTHTIELAFCYLFADDLLVRKLLLITLMDCAKRGVQVRIMLDGETSSSASVKALLKLDDIMAEVQEREIEARARTKTWSSSVAPPISSPAPTLDPADPTLDPTLAPAPVPAPASTESPPRPTRARASTKAQELAVLFVQPPAALPNQITSTFISAPTSASASASASAPAPASMFPFFGKDSSSRMTTTDKLKRAMMRRWNAGTERFEDAPALETYATFLQKLYAAAAQPEVLGNFQILWYVQKDKEVGYAVKGHSKMYIFDRQIAIIGGSNLMPTASTMNDDCDVMTKGPAAAEISDIFRLRWMAHKSQTPQVCSNYFDAYTDPDYSASPSPVSDVDVGGWDDDEAYPKVVYSEPSIHGDDPIFRAVLGVLRSAKREFRMCMGFAAFTAPFIAHCYEATGRGVRVQLLCNSRYSADLSCPQTDMCLSIAALLRHAPLVEVYVTLQKREEDDFIPTMTTVSAEGWGTTDAGEKAETGEGEDKAEEVRARARTLTYAMKDAAASMQQGSLGPRPTFVHSKYVVADSTLVCLGSWNCWPRSSFYEHECNVVVSAPGLARRIENKFETAKKSNAVRLRDPEMLAKGGMFTPLGCSICKPYGPCLFTDELCQGAMAQLAELEKTKAET